MSSRKLCSLFALGFLLSSGCATEPDALDKSRPEAVAKKLFAGTWHYNLTVTNSEWENRFTFIGEQTNTHDGKPIKLRWEISEDRLNGYMVPQAYRDEHGQIVDNDKLHQQSLILAFRIVDHFDIRYRYNPTTREELPILEENRDRPWQEREHMKVDWSQSLVTNVWAPTGRDVAMGALQRDQVGYEHVEFYVKGDEGDRQVDPRSYNADKDGDVSAINIDTKESFSTALQSWMQLYYGSHMEPTTVKFRHSLLKAKPFTEETYQPLDYPDEHFRRFGFFRTEYDVYDAVTHKPTYSQKKFYANRWDLSGDKQIVWTLSPSTQKAINDGDTQIKEILQKVCDSWDKSLKEATGRQDQVVVMRENEVLLDDEGNELKHPDGALRWRYELGDLRYSFINFVFKQNLAQPLGYGPVTPDADTGRIVSGVVNIYAGWTEYVIQRALDQYDVAAGNCSLDDIKVGRHFDPETGACSRGPAGPAADGPIAQNGVSSMVQDTPHALGTGMSQLPKGQGSAWHRSLTPALRTAYYPKVALRGVAQKEAIQQSIKAALPQLEALHQYQQQHPLNLDLGGFATVSGTAYESALLPGGNMHSLMPHALGTSDPGAIAELSPAQRLSATALAEQRALSIRASAVRDDPTFFEPAINAFVGEMKDKPRNEVEERLRYWIYYTTTQHEMGHTLGLRHNFAASADRKNFQAEYEPAYNEYWDKIEALRAQYKPQIDRGDTTAYETYVRAVDALPSTHDRFASTSIMDYFGDWHAWSAPVRSYDRAALAFAYGQKVEVDGGNGWSFQPYKPGDFVAQGDPADPATMAQSGRKVRYYLFCSDEKVFDDAFCNRFDRGTTATEIVRNFIKTTQTSYIFSNFNRDSSSFENTRRGYYMRKWLYKYYMYAKPFAQITVNSTRYPEFWGSLFDGISALGAGPEDRNMKPGYFRDGGEDLLRAALLYYNFLLYDVLMRPDYGHYELTHDAEGNRYWASTKARFLDEGSTSVFVPAGVGWGFADRWDVQQDPESYYERLTRVGVEVDKAIALEILSIPAVFNSPLTYEKANGTSFWNSLWTGNGQQLWTIIRGMITDDFTHAQNPWCMRCDEACQADPKANPPVLEVHPVDYLEGVARAGLLNNYPLPQEGPRCGPDAYPVQPGMDDLFAIKPMFYAIAGASHPWYSNALAERLDSQVKGGAHRFDIPEGAEVAEFKNPSGTKTYQAVQTTDGLSVSYALVDKGRRIRNRVDFVDACLAGEDTTPFEGKLGTHDRTCTDVKRCYPTFGEAAAFCAEEGWDSSFGLDALKYRSLDRVEAMLIMMQDMIDIAGHYAWRTPGYLRE